METEIIVKQITVFLDKLGMSFNEAITHYTQWYVSSSLAWMLFSVFLCFGSVYGFKYLMNYDALDSYDRRTLRGWAIFLLFLGLFIGAIIFFSQIGDLIGARGMAIHKLIGDIRG